LAAVLAVAILGPAVFLILPAFVGALAETFGFSDAQLGLLASADLFGMGVAAATGLYWLRRWPWQRVVRPALLVVVLGNLAATVPDDFSSLVSIRLVVGCAGGMIMAVAMAFFAHREDPNRAMAWLLVGQVTFIVVALSTLPPVVEAYGVDSIFAILALLTGGLLLVVRFIPARAPAGDAARTQGGRPLVAVLVLVSIAMFFVAQSGLWAFVGLIGENAGLSTSEVATALALSTTISLLGPLYGVVVSERFGCRPPIIVGLACHLVVVVWMSFYSYGFVGFLILLSLFQLGWNLPLSYQFSVLVRRDVSRRLVALVPTFQAMGIAAGPVVLGFAIESSGYGVAPQIAAACLLAYAVLLIPLAGMKSVTDDPSVEAAA
jgi:predicted MFS family arabinose efflux permease